jgi:peptidoglycan/LPS O-acetylase OafA/YrhL
MNWRHVFRRDGAGLIPGLDGLRAISILCVIYGHLLFAPSFTARALVSLVNPAGLGVRLFFVISGFLITSILLKERAQTGTISLRRFYYRRLLRIFPAYYVFLACVFALAWLGVIALERSDFFYTLTYTFNMKGRQDTWWVGHTWSLAVEEQFYLLWPLVLQRCRRSTALKVALASAFIPPIARGALLMYSSAVYDHWFQTLPLVADPLAIGAVLAFAMDRVDWKGRVLGLVNHRAWLLAPALVVVFEGLDHRPNFFPHPVVYVALLQPLASVGLAIVVARFSLVTSGSLSRVMNSAPIVAIGVMSYSLYLWQMLFINAVDAPLLRFPLNVMWAALAATASYVLVEQPFNRLRERKPRTAAARVPGTASAVTG